MNQLRDLCQVLQGEIFGFSWAEFEVVCIILMRGGHWNKDLPALSIDRLAA